MVTYESKIMKESGGGERAREGEKREGERERKREMRASGRDLAADCRPVVISRKIDIFNCKKEKKNKYKKGLAMQRHGRGVTFICDET